MNGPWDPGSPAIDNTFRRRTDSQDPMDQRHSLKGSRLSMNERKRAFHTNAAAILQTGRSMSPSSYAAALSAEASVDAPKNSSTVKVWRISSVTVLRLAMNQ